jgi:hypothetical protein
MPGFEAGQRERDLRRQIGHRNAGRDDVVNLVRNERQMFWPNQQPFLPRAILADAVGSCEHHAASHREPRVAGVLNNTRALIAEHQRRLGSRVSTRQDRVFQRRDTGCRDAHEHPVLCRLRLAQFDMPQPAIARESVRLDRQHRHAP